MFLQVAEIPEQITFLFSTQHDIHSFYPVSYTHLDVYKRQAYYGVLRTAINRAYKEGIITVNPTKEFDFALSLIHI